VRIDPTLSHPASTRPLDPTLTLLIAASISAAMAGLGPVPLIGRDRAPLAALGWANALAAGLMLGPAFLLMSAAMPSDPLPGALGAAVGIAFVWLSHRVGGSGELDLNQLGDTDEVYGYRVMLINALHAASEGVAIGAAMGVSVPFGVFMAAAMAIHNVPESTILTSILKGRGLRWRVGAGFAVLTNVPQILLAVVTYAIVSAAPGFSPWAIGFAFGSLVYLVLAELLPECYRQAGRTTMALVTIVAMGMVVLLDGLVG